MSHPDAYRTVVKVSTGEFRDRGSKFLAYLYPCISEDELKGHSDELRKEHSGSRHVCYAATIGSSEPHERFNDDGEPSGTAGQPMLNQLLSAELKNVALYVVRYFGGTKLGKPGLINAYKESAREAIDTAKIKTHFNTQQLTFIFGYDATGTVMNAIQRIPHASIISQEYAQQHTLHVAVPVSEVSNALHLFDHSDEITSHIIDP